MNTEEKSIEDYESEARGLCEGREMEGLWYFYRHCDDSVWFANGQMGVTIQVHRPNGGAEQVAREISERLNLA